MSTIPPDKPIAKIGLSTDLLAWYRSHKRSLPWRDRQNDPYAVWVSEIMLQQTTVNAVIGFYNRWMERFPTLTALAEAPLDDVLKYWAGLGYYARARNLKAAAEEVVERFGGVVPKTTKELMSLPGVGRYTAGAISSIAYNVDSPIVDANVIRVLCRLFALHGDPKTSRSLQNTLWETAESLIPTGEARDFNQGLMELGALICQPTAPQCGLCPVAEQCEAKQTGDPISFPEFGDAKKWIEVTHAACFIEVDEKLLIVQRPLDQLWGGLWELPRAAVEPGEEPSDAAVRAVNETVGITVTSARKVASLRHVVTNRRVLLLGFAAKWDGIGEAVPNACRQFAWVAVDALDKYAISSPQIELLSLWRKAKKQPLLDL